MSPAIRRAALALGVVAVFAAPPAASAAEKKPKVVVLGIKPIDDSTVKIAASLTEILTTDVARTRRFEVLGESDLGSMLGFERQKQLLGCSDTGCLAEIGGALGADYLLLGTLGRVGKQISLDLKLADSRKSRIAARDGVLVDEVDGLVGAGRQVLQALLAQLEPANAPAAATTPAVAPLAVRAESAGIGAAPVVVMGLGAAALLSGAAYTGLVLASKADYSYEEADAGASLGMIVAGAGLVTFAAGATWALVRASGPSSPSAAVGLAPIAGGGMLCAAGSF